MDTSAASLTDQDKRNKREIANSNERRRMQSINAGFQNLRQLLPSNDGEKLSKASILQQATELIEKIQHDKSQLTSILLSIRNGTPVSSALASVDLDAILSSTTATLQKSSTANTNVSTSPSTAPTTPTSTSNVKIKTENSSLCQSINETQNDSTAANLFTHQNEQHTQQLHQHQEQTQPQSKQSNQKKISSVKRVKIETPVTTADQIPTAASNIIQSSTITTHLDNQTLEKLSKSNATSVPSSEIEINNLNQSCKLISTPCSTNKTTVLTSHHPVICPPSTRFPQEPTETRDIGNIRNGLVSFNDSVQQDSMSGSAKAAIALPLEVPYNFETVVSNSMTEKRQNLDTICQAIQQIEGGCVFNDDEK